MKTNKKSVEGLNSRSKWEKRNEWIWRLIVTMQAKEQREKEWGGKGTIV